MGKLYLTGKGLIKKDGKSMSSYEYKENEEIIFEFLPFTEKGVKAVPYAASIRIEEGIPILDSDQIAAVKWKEDYELRFEPMIIESYIPPEALAQNAIYDSSGDIVATVYKDSRIRVSVEAPDIFYIHTVPCNIEEPQIRMNQTGNRTIIAVTGKYEEQSYLLIIMVTDTCKVLYESVADKITYNQNSIQVTKSLKDMKGRLLRQTLSFNGTRYAETERSYECAYDHKYKQELIPYAFLEGVMAGDYNDARTYLDKNLDSEGITEFFGEIKEISEPKYADYGEGHIAVITRTGNMLTATVYKFDITDGLITNIIERD